MPEIRILDQHRVPALDPARKGKDDLVVSYSVNNARGYMVRVPAENASAAAIEAAVRADVALHSTIVGKTFQT